MKKRESIVAEAEVYLVAGISARKMVIKQRKSIMKRAETEEIHSRMQRERRGQDQDLECIYYLILSIK